MVKEALILLCSLVVFITLYDGIVHHRNPLNSLAYRIKSTFLSGIFIRVFTVVVASLIIYLIYILLKGTGL